MSERQIRPTGSPQLRLWMLTAGGMMGGFGWADMMGGWQAMHRLDVGAEAACEAFRFPFWSP